MAPNWMVMGHCIKMVTVLILRQPTKFSGDPKYEAMPEGQMFYSITYGKNLMGPYASQLSRKQRWMVIDYIKSKQGATRYLQQSTTATVQLPAT